MRDKQQQWRAPTCRGLPAPSGGRKLCRTPHRPWDYPTVYTSPTTILPDLPVHVLPEEQGSLWGASRAVLSPRISGRISRRVSRIIARRSPIPGIDPSPPVVPLVEVPACPSAPLSSAIARWPNEGLGWIKYRAKMCRCLSTQNSQRAVGGIAHASDHTSHRVRPWMLTLSNCIKPYQNLMSQPQKFSMEVRRTVIFCRK